MQKFIIWAKKTKNKTKIKKPKITLAYYEITSNTLRVQKQPRIVHIIWKNDFNSKDDHQLF